MVNTNYGVEVDATIDHKLVKEVISKVADKVGDFTRYVKYKTGGYTLDDEQRQAIEAKGIKESFVEELKNSNISDEQIQEILANKSIQEVLQGYNSEAKNTTQIQSDTKASSSSRTESGVPINLESIAVYGSKDISEFIVDGAKAVNAVVDKIGETNAAAAVLVLQVAIEGPVRTVLSTLGDEVKDEIFGGAKDTFSEYIADDLFDINNNFEEQDNEEQKAIGSLSDGVADFTVDSAISGSAIGIIKGAKNLADKSDGFDSSIGVGNDITPIVISNMPQKLNHNASSGVKLEVNPDKTTTVLGSYNEDMKDILAETNYPKTLDFEAKQGGFNVLNTPDSLYKTPEQFWKEYNKPFLDKAIERGDDIVLATKPDSTKNLTNGSFKYSLD